MKRFYFKTGETIAKNEWRFIGKESKIRIKTVYKKIVHFGWRMPHRIVFVIFLSVTFSCPLNLVVDLLSNLYKPK